MDDGSRLPLISAVLLLFVAVFFAVAETAFASTTRTRMRVAEERGDMRAREALYVLDNFDLAISAILIGTNIVHISVAALVTYFRRRSGHPRGHAPLGPRRGVGQHAYHHRCGVLFR